jgi:hypothetical protein
MAMSLGVSLALADTPASNQVVSFVSCPIYRDTDAGRKSGCWLSDNRENGVRYDVTDAPIKPLLGREILIEGVVTNKPDTCGGMLLNPVRVAVLPTQCPNSMLPAERYPGRPFVLPRTLPPNSTSRTLPPPPYVDRSYVIEFELNSDFLRYQHAEVILDEVVQYVKAATPKRIVVTAYAATKPIKVSGHEIAESIDVAKARAAMIVLALTRLDVPRALIVVETRGDPTPDGELAAAGLAETSKRHATVRIEM